MKQNLSLLDRLVASLFSKYNNAANEPDVTSSKPKKRRGRRFLIATLLSLGIWTGFGGDATAQTWSGGNQPANRTANYWNTVTWYENTAYNRNNDPTANIGAGGTKTGRDSNGNYQYIGYDAWGRTYNPSSYTYNVIGDCQPQTQISFNGGNSVTFNGSATNLQSRSVNVNLAANIGSMTVSGTGWSFSGTSITNGDNNGTLNLQAGSGGSISLTGAFGGFRESNISGGWSIVGNSVSYGNITITGSGGLGTRNTSVLPDGGPATAGWMDVFGTGFWSFTAAKISGSGRMRINDYTNTTQGNQVLELTSTWVTLPLFGLTELKTELLFDGGIDFNTGPYSTIFVGNDNVFGTYNFTTHATRNQMTLYDDLQWKGDDASLTFGHRTVVTAGTGITYNISHDKLMTFTGVNTSGAPTATMQGGALYLHENTYIRHYTDGTNNNLHGTLQFRSNTARQGAAIYAKNDLTIDGWTRFDNNLATQPGGVGGGGEGGAIYMRGESPGGNSLILDTTIGDIVFNGNQSNDGTGPVANDIHLYENIAVEMTGDRYIYMNGGFSSDAWVGGHSLDVNLPGTTFVQFGANSNSQFTTFGTGGGEVNVNSGTFRVNGSATTAGRFSTLGGEAKFTLANGATLAGGGIVEANIGIILNGTISPDYHEYGTPTGVLSNNAPSFSVNNSIGNLTLRGNVTLDDQFTYNIDLNAGGFRNDTAIPNTYNFSDTIIVEKASAGIAAGNVNFGSTDNKSLIDIKTWSVDPLTHSAQYVIFAIDGQADITNENVMDYFTIKSTGAGQIGGVGNDNYRRAASLFVEKNLGVSGSGNETNIVLNASDNANVYLYWNGSIGGGGDLWNGNTTPLNWLWRGGAYDIQDMQNRTFADAAPAMYFLDGDYLYFTDDANVQDIILQGKAPVIPGDPETLIVSGMEIISGDYVFLHDDPDNFLLKGQLNDAGTPFVGVMATGQLRVTGDGTAGSTRATFYVDTDFERGTVLRDGAHVIIRKDAALGAYDETVNTGSNLNYNTAKGVVTVTGGLNTVETIIDPITIKNHFEVESGATLQLRQAAGGTFTISGVTAYTPTTHPDYAPYTKIYNGGAIYLEAGAEYLHNPSATSTLIFENNHAIEGGAIYTEADLTIYGNTVFDGNTAVNNGGAIFGNSGGTIKFDTTDGNIVFQNNKSGRNVDDLPAVGVANSVYLNRYYDLTFTGSNNVFFYDPIASGGVGRNTMATDDTFTGFVQFDGNGGANPDNVLNRDDNPGGYVTWNGGTLRLTGDATFIAGGSDGGQITLGAEGTFAGNGTFRVKAGAPVASSKTFLLSGTLAPDSDVLEIKTNGTIGPVAPADPIGTLTFVGSTRLEDATLEIDLGAGAGAGVAGDSDRIIIDHEGFVNGKVTFAGKNSINTTVLTGVTINPLVDEYLILESDVAFVGANGETTDAELLKYFRVSGAGRQRAELDIRESLALSGDFDQLWLVNYTDKGSARIYWTGKTANAGVGDWDVDTTENWTDQGKTVDLKFLHNDYVIFDQSYLTGDAETDVYLTDPAAMEMTTVGMEIVSGNYTFTTDAVDPIAIFGRTNLGDLDPSDQTGILKVIDGTATLAVVTDFVGGTLMSGTTGGRINIANDAALGVYDHAGALAYTYDPATGITTGSRQGYVNVTGIGAIGADNDFTVANRFEVAADGELTFDVGAGATLTIDGVTTDAATDGGAVYIAADGKLSNIGAGTLKFSNNTARDGGAIFSVDALTLDGKLEFADNEATAHGGAIRTNDLGSDLSVINDVTFTGNIAGTDGGAISSIGAVKLGNNVNFENNTATAGFGGAIDSLLDTTIGTGATFTENEAGTRGGAIDSGAATTLGTGATFTDNVAGTSGGAIHSVGDVTLGTGTTFDGNEAGTSGGAIYAESNVTVAAGTTFTDNIAGTSGGAIYMLGGADADNKNTLTFNTGTADIEFTGNTVAGAAESVHLNRFTDLVVNGTGDVYFNDPIKATAGGNTFTMDGSGTVYFSGDSVLNVGAGQVDINTGTMRLVGGATFDAGNSEFNLDAAMTGFGKATATTFTITGTLSPDNLDAATPSDIGTLAFVGAATFDGAELCYDFAAGNLSDLIDITGTLDLLGTNEVIFNDKNLVEGIYDIIISSGTLFTAQDLEDHFADLDYNKNSIRDNAYLRVDPDNNNIIQLVVEFADGYALLWSGDKDGGWSTDKNWLRYSDRTTEETFVDGDYIVFDNTGEDGAPVNLAGTVTVYGMEIRGGNYTFESDDPDATIVGQLIPGSLFTPGGGLTQEESLLISGGATTFKIATNFVKGITIDGTVDNDVSVTIGHNRALGAFTATDNSGLVKVHGNVTLATLAGAYTISNRFTDAGGDSADVTLNVVSGGTLTVDNNNVAALDNGGFIGVQGDVTLNTTNGTLTVKNAEAVNGGAVAANGNVTVGNTRTTTRFENNRAIGHSGGAIWAGGNVDLTNIQFVENRAEVSNGGAINAGGIVTIGGTASFTDNYAAISGGAVYNWGDVETKIGANARFTDNVAATGGGGAIWTRGDVTLATNSRFNTNTAGTIGGAIYAESDVTLAAGTTFTGNIAGTSGGAIYMLGGADADNKDTLTFNTGNADIVFTDNTAAGAANAVHLNRFVDVVVNGNGNVRFNDPIDATTGGNTFTMDGTGTVYFSGNSFLNRGAVAGTVDINTGTMRLVDGATFDAGNSVFTLAQGATLSGDGGMTATTFVINGTLWAQGLDSSIDTLTFNGNTTFDGATLNIDLDAPGTPGVSDQIIVNGNVDAGNASTVTIGNYLASSFEDGVFDVLITTGADTLVLSDFEMDETKYGTRNEATLRLSADEKTLQIVTKADAAATLYWTGQTDDNIWASLDKTKLNWIDEFSPAGTQQYFMNGDYVIFTENATYVKQHVVALESDLDSYFVEVSGMEIVDADYEFIGTGTGTGKTILGNSATGADLLIANATATFTDIDVNFDGDVRITDSNVTFGNNLNVGNDLTVDNTGLADSAFTANSDVNVTGGVKMENVKTMTFNGDVNANGILTGSPSGFGSFFVNADDYDTPSTGTSDSLTVAGAVTTFSDVAIFNVGDVSFQTLTTTGSPLQGYLVVGNVGTFTVDGAANITGETWLNNVNSATFNADSTFGYGLFVSNSNITLNGDNTNDFGTLLFGTTNVTLGSDTAFGAANVFVDVDADVTMFSSDPVRTLGNDIVNDGNLTIDAAGMWTYTGNMTGSGNFTKDGLGTLLVANDGNAIDGMVSINNGTMQMAAGSKFASAGPFVLDEGATLTGNGEISASGNLLFGTISAGDATDVGHDFGTLALTGNTFLSGTVIDIYVGANNAGNKIDVTGQVFVDADKKNTVNIANDWVVGEYVVITTTGGFAGTKENVLEQFVVTYNGSGLSKRDNVILDLKQQDKNLVLTLGEMRNLSLVWQGGISDQWDDATDNWIDTDDENERIRFRNRDYVIFDHRGIEKDVRITDDFNVAGMEINASGYVFSGGKITGAKTADDFSTGKLAIGTTGTVTINNEMAFEKGTELDGTGNLTVKLGNNKALGTTGNAREGYVTVSENTNATFEAVGGSVDASNPLQNRFESKGGSMAFADTDWHFTNSETGTAEIIKSAGNVTIGGAAAFTNRNATADKGWAVNMTTPGTDLTLNASQGDFVFEGSDKAAILLNGGNTMTLAGSGDFDFQSGIYGIGANDFRMNGTGTATLYGKNTIGDADSHATIASGTLQLTDGARLNAGQFVLGGNATLDSKGISKIVAANGFDLNGTVKVADTLQLDGDATFSDITYVVAWDENGSSLIDITGEALFVGANTLSLSGSWYTGTYDLAVAALGLTDESSDDWTILFNGSTVAGDSRHKAELKVVDGTILQLTTGSENLGLIWTNACGNKFWSGSTNWKTVDDGTAIKFIDGDLVYFDGEGTGKVKIAENVTVGDMIITAGNYHFESYKNGYEILGSGNVSSIGNTSGSLLISGGESVFDLPAKFDGRIDITGAGTYVEITENGKLQAERRFLLGIGSTLVMTPSEGSIKGSSVTFNGNVVAVRPDIHGITIDDISNVIEVTGAGNQLNTALMSDIFNISYGLIEQNAVFSQDEKIMDLTYSSLTPTQFANKYKMSGNEKEVANNLTNIFADPNTDMEALRDLLYRLETVEEVRSAIDQMRGSEMYADGLTMALWSPWRKVFANLDVEEYCPNGHVVAASPKKINQRNFWFDGYYRHLETHTDRNARKYTEKRGGMMIGLDTKLTLDTTAGLNFGYGNPHLSHKFGKLEANDYTLALYAQTRVTSESYLRGYLGMGIQDNEGERHEYIYGQKYDSKYDGYSMYVSLEWFRPIKYDQVKLFPLVALDYQRAWNDEFEETGGAFAQRINKASMENLVARIGVNAKWFETNRTSLKTRLQYGYLLGGDAHGDTKASFVSNPVGGGFMNLNGVNLGRNRLNAGIGGDWYVGSRKGMRLFLDYDYDCGDRTDAHTGQVGFDVRW